MPRNAAASADVRDDESVLRRFLATFYHGSNVPLDPGAFSPTPADETGLSVFREAFVRPDEVAAAGKSAKAYAVTRLGVGELKRRECSVVADPRDDTLPGHALIPELGEAARRRNRERFADRRREVCQLAAASVCWPDR